MSNYIASPQEIRDGIEHYKRIMKEEKERERAKKLEEIRSRKPIVINLFGAPGAGKSTGAAMVFAALKNKPALMQNSLQSLPKIKHGNIMPQLLDAKSTFSANRVID